MTGLCESLTMFALGILGLVMMAWGIYALVWDAWKAKRGVSKCSICIAGIIVLIIGWRFAVTGFSW
ncbi:MAG: hypothetical protein V3S21_07535 [Xanthomonadales bacterium]